MKKTLFFLLFLPCLVKSQIKDRTKQFDHTIKATTVTVSTGDSSTNIANTAWVKRQGYGSGGGGGTVTSVSGTSNRISSTGGTTPVIDIDAAYVGQTSITTLGTIGTGTWNATTIGLTKGGTGQTTANASFNALAPSQTSNSGKFLTTDGSNTSWATITAITASDTAAISDRSWRVIGNAPSPTGYQLLGTTNLKSFKMITNNVERMRFDSTGRIIVGAGSDLSTNYGFQVNGVRSLFTGTSPSANALHAGGDDGQNDNVATFAAVTGSNSFPTAVFSIGATTTGIMIRPFASATNAISIGGGVNNTYFGILHSYSLAPTLTWTYAYSARNTYNPTSGVASRYAFEDSTVINQTGTATGVYISFYAHPVLTAAADYRAFQNDAGTNLLNKNSGNTGIGISSGPTARLHLAASTTSAASLRLPSGTAPTSPNHGDMWTDADHIYSRLNGVTYQLDQQASTNIYNSDGVISGARTVTGAANNLTFTDINNFNIYSSFFSFAKTDGSARYMGTIGVAASNQWQLGYFKNGVVGPAIRIDTNQHVIVGGSYNTTFPLYATGSSLFVGNGLVSLAGNFIRVTNITSNTTIDLTYCFMTIDATGGNVTITLPAASSAFGGNVGIIYKFQRIDASGNTITIQRAGSDTINGATSFTLTTQWELKELQCTSTTTWGLH